MKKDKLFETENAQIFMVLCSLQKEHINVKIKVIPFLKNDTYYVFFRKRIFFQKKFSFFLIRTGIMCDFADSCF